MVRINRIYTKTGDKGETGLVGGRRAGKDDLRVQAYGEVDELNAHLGVCRTLAEQLTSAITGELAVLQNELFDMGAQLATPPDRPLQGVSGISDDQITRLEAQIDHFIEGLPELRSFVLPGGTALNAALHVARTVCRRCERTVVALSRQEPVAPQIIAYLNRLSDLLFAMARNESHRAGIPEYLWKPRS